MVLNCETNGYGSKYEDLPVHKAERILEFICLKNSLSKPPLTKKDLNIYLSEILKLLEKKEVFTTITKLLIENNSLSNDAELTQVEQGILLTLCLYHYSKSTRLYWSKVSETVGVFPDINIFFDAINTPLQGESGYALYHIAQSKVLFLQLVGRGAHNNAYLLWSVRIEEGKFKAVLLDIPQYIEESKALQIILSS